MWLAYHAWPMLCSAFDEAQVNWSTRNQRSERVATSESVDYYIVRGVTHNRIYTPQTGYTIAQAVAKKP